MRLVKREATPWSSRQKVDRVANTRVSAMKKDCPSSIPSRLRLPVFPHRLPQIKAPFAPRENPRGILVLIGPADALEVTLRLIRVAVNHETVILRHKTIADSMHGEISVAAIFRFQLPPRPQDVRIDGTRVGIEIMAPNLLCRVRERVFHALL
jgi:hypothetical protein